MVVAGLSLGIVESAAELAQLLGGNVNGSGVSKDGTRGVEWYSGLSERWLELIELNETVIKSGMQDLSSEEMALLKVRCNVRSLLLRWAVPWCPIWCQDTQQCCLTLL